jgi:hypothetical protein
LHNSVYQKTQYFPYRNQLVWQNKEEMQKQKIMSDHYRLIRDEYKTKIAEMFNKHDSESQTPIDDHN